MAMQSIGSTEAQLRSAIIREWDEGGTPLGPQSCSLGESSRARRIQRNPGSDVDFDEEMSALSICEHLRQVSKRRLIEENLQKTHLWFFEERCAAHLSW